MIALLMAEPDTQWSYSSGAADIVALIVRHALEKESPFCFGLIREKLFDRIGVASALFEPDSLFKRSDVSGPDKNRLTVQTSFAGKSN